MAETTGISWTRSTFNPWIGCTRIGPGCDHCYAEALDKRHKWGGAVHWGAGVPRYRTSQSTWEQPLKWNKAQEIAFGEYARAMSPENPRPMNRPDPWRVFCASLADVFDNEVPDAWRTDLWSLIRATPYLSWLIVTKRIGNVQKMIPGAWTDAFPPNVRLLITVCNEGEADRDVPKLLALPCKNGISYEPALGPVDWWQIPVTGTHGDMCDLRQIGWIIVGGESTQGKGKARPFDLAWARSTVAQCKAAGVPVFVKQLGAHPVSFNTSPHDSKLYDVAIKDRAGADPAEWPEDLRVQEFPT